MQFGPSVVLFGFCGIPMAGNLANGFAVGLTAEGFALCQRFACENVPDEEARAANAELVACLQQAGFFNREPAAPELRSAYLHVTQRCNLQCAGCYSLDDSRNASTDLSTEQLLDFISQLAAAGVASLFISGGEPFLRNDLLALVGHAKECGIGTVTIITNGTCISREVLGELAGFADSISVSFDGYSAEATPHIRGVQRFDQLVDAVRLIREAGIPAHIIPTIHRKNVHDLSRYTALAAELGVTMNYSLLSCECGPEGELASLIPDEAALEALADELLALGSAPALSGAPVGLNLAVRTSCGAGHREISVAADGTVYPCHMLHRPEYALGNLHRESLDAILQREAPHWRATLYSRNVEECSSCRHRLLCGGGCRARSVYAKGNLTSCDSYCAFMKRYYDQLGSLLAAQVATRS